MKGMLVGFLITIWYAVSSVSIAHFTRPKRHSRLLVLGLIAWIPVYFLVYFLTPDDFFCLPTDWQLSPRWLDALYGFGVYILTAHDFSFILFSIVGGFSVALLAAVPQSGATSATTESLANLFKVGDGTDRIYSWRVPHLAASGYLQKDPTTGKYSLTPKGRLIAVLARTLKRAMNLGAGG